MTSRKTRESPVASSSPCERSQRTREHRDSSPEPCGRLSRSSSCSSSGLSSGETDPCTESSPQVDEISRSLTNNVSLGSPRPRRHSSPGTPPSEVRRRRGGAMLGPVSPSARPPVRPASLSRMWLLVPVVAVLLVFAFWLRIQSSAPSRQSRATPAALAEAKLALREAFPEQPNKTWTTFAAELRALLREEAPVRPAVLLLVGGQKSVTLPCLARRLAGQAAALLGGASCRALTPEDEEAVSEDAEKLAMDQEVQGAYARGERCFHFGRLERLPKQQLLLMHAWCDGDHSPFTRALFLLVLRTQETMQNESRVEQFLLDHWTKKVGLDEAGALNSRLANSIIIVREEENLVHERSCVHPA